MPLRRLGLVMLLVLGAGHSLRAQHQDVFACDLHSWVSVSNDGRLTKDEDPLGVQLWRRFTIDTVSGLLRFAADPGNTGRWEVVQRPSSSGDFVALLDPAVPRHILYIRTWKKPITFMAVDFDSVFSGTCQPVK